MKFKIPFLTILSICTFSFGFSGITPKINAQVEIIGKTEAGIDISAIREDINYNLPQNIVIVPIINEQLAELNSNLIYQGLFYYTVEALGFNDIPFHYIVSENGDVYEGNGGGDERRILVDEIGDDSVIIAYIPKRTTSKFSNKANNVLADLLTEIANRNSIDPRNITVSGIKFIRDEELRSVSIAADEVFGQWNSSLRTIQEEVAENYSPIKKDYSVRIESISYEPQNVSPGTTVDYTVTVANESRFGIYGGTDSELVLTKTTDGESAFFLNNEWLSINQVGIMQPDEILLPFSEATFTFKARAPLAVGELAEDFDIRNLIGDDVSDSNFRFSMNISSGDRRIVEITQTETGTLNVRNEASSVAPAFTQVSPGQRFFVTEDAGNGWIRIELNSGEQGWISTRYAFNIN